MAHGIWGKMLQLCGVQWVMLVTVKDLLSLYPFLHWPKAGRTLWKSAMATIIWTIWNERNSRIFQGIAIAGPALFPKVTSLVTFWASNHRTFARFPANTFLCNWKNIMLHRPRKAQRSHNWRPPSLGNIKLNFDGCSLGNLGHAGAGGVFKDHHRAILFMFPNTWASKTLSMPRQWPS
ncbi:hypothetical protein AMTRI_Chr01g104330 [Amborella trichopoda]